ncbi:flagellar motor switch protein FliN [Litoribacillus peritrichatus]|uniref:Flagellar motor switch protein FliN n=1 Tax=Litoribacillus peritrichatus TaxID=718191 RepID=A0ABP7M3V7_9GAMM
MADENTPEGQEENVDQDQLSDEWAAAMEEAGAGGSESGDEAVSEKNKILEPDNEPMEGDMLADPNNPNLDVILDIPVTISMEVGNTEISIRNLLQLNQGSVIELDRLAGEPLDVLVNGQLIAHGEVVMVNEKFGIRLTDVVSPTERIKKLR